MAVSRVSQAQLERALGGAKYLLELADRENTGSLGSEQCQAFIDDVLQEGFAEVNGYISPAVDLSDPALMTAPMLVRYELAVDAHLAWLKGTGGVGEPDNIKAEYDRIIGELEKIARRDKGLGLLNRPASSQPIQQVTKDDTEDFFSPVGPRRRFDGWS